MHIIYYNSTAIITAFSMQIVGIIRQAVTEMQKTKIFVSAASDNLKRDISEIESFFRRMNDCYLDRGHYFTLLLDDDVESSASEVSYTTSFDEGENDRNAAVKKLSECELAFFLLGSESIDEQAGAYKYASESYSRSGKPGIYAYVKTQDMIPSAQDPNQDSPPQLAVSISGAAATRHYSHTDTLKLGILMQIKQLELDGVDIRLEGGRAWQGNTALMTLDNVETVSGYENLQKLKQDRAALENRYVEAKARFLANPDDAAAYEEFVEATRRRSEAIEEIRDIEAQLFSMVEGMYIQTSAGKLSQRQAEAYRLAERGLLAEARDVLDFYAIVSDSRHEDEAAEQIAARVQVHVNEQLQLKDINAALLDWEGVDECYMEAVRLEEKHNLPRYATLSYLEYLYYKRRYNEAIKLGEALRRHYMSPESREPAEDKSLMYNLLGIVYYSSSQMAEAEEILKESLHIRSSRKEGDPDIIGRDIAAVYNSLGNLYYLEKRFDEAVEAHEAALEIRKRLAAKNHDAYEEFLAYTYVNLGAVYDDMEKSKESAEITLLAIETFKRLAVTKPDPFEGFLSAAYVNLGAAYANLQRYEEAEQQFETALKMQLRLTAENPDAFGFRLGETYIEFGRLYLKANRYQDAQEKLTTAIDKYQKMASYDPGAYEPSLAACYASIAELYVEMNLFQDAESALNNAVRLYDKYSGSNPAHAESAAEARKKLAGLGARLLRSGEVKSALTAQEQDIALLLTEGVSKGEIARKQHISVAELELIVSAIREKVVGIADTDPVVTAVVRDYKLTGREADMLRCLRQNMGNEAIAGELFLSDETVRKHMRSLLKKLPVERRQDVPAWLDSYAI